MYVVFPRGVNMVGISPNDAWGQRATYEKGARIALLSKRESGRKYSNQVRKMRSEAESHIYGSYLFAEKGALTYWLKKDTTWNKLAMVGVLDKTEPI